MEFYNKLYHYGIPGMKWRVHRGPPYPIDDKKTKARPKKEDMTNLSISASKRYLKKHGSDKYTEQSRIILPKKEYAHVHSEIMTWLKKDERWTKAILSKPIGNFIYTFYNSGDREIVIIDKRKNKK